MSTVWFLTWSVLAEVATVFAVKPSAHEAVTFLVNSRRAGRVASGPATLEEYCAGGGGNSLEKGAKVEADWNGYGTYYSGKVTESEEGKVTIHYDDGFDETIEDDDGDGEFSRVKPTETSSKTKGKPKDDPACEMKDFVGKVKEKVNEIASDMAMWAANKQAEASGKKKKPKSSDYKPPPPEAEQAQKASVGAPAPASYVAAAPDSETEYVIPDDASAEQKSQLQKLIDRLKALDDEIKAVGADVDFNDLALQKEMEADGAMAGKSDPIDDLIAKYTARIEEREIELEKLKARRAKQEKALAAYGADSISLDSIADAVEDLDSDLAKVREKRDELEKRGKLDEELGHLIKELLKSGGKIKSKFDALREADRKSQARKEALAVGEGLSDEVSQAASDMEAADAEVLAAAKDLQKDIGDLNEKSSKMETDLHPHGAKWWRYRYEHSFVEALVMVLVTILMVLWEKVVLEVRMHSYGVEDFESKVSQGTMVAHWIEHLALELMACTLVFLTVFGLAQSYFFELLPIWLPESKQLHLPTTGEEYSRLALDICGILFTAVVLYYLLAYAIVSAAQKQIAAWAKAGTAVTRQGVGKTKTMGFNALKDLTSMSEYFIHHVQKQPKVFQAALEESEKQARDMNMDVDGKKMNIAAFPFWKYLRVTVRYTLDGMTMFGWWMWLLICITFAVLMLLHYFAHIGYVRVTIVFLIILFFFGSFMLYFMKSAESFLANHSEQDGEIRTPRASVAFKGRQAVVITEIMQYVLFFLSYAFARVACQRWMWELHFYPVLGITIFTIFFTLFLVFAVAPVMPFFAAACYMPPYLDLSDTPSAKAELVEIFVLMYGMEDVDTFIRNN